MERRILNILYSFFFLVCSTSAYAEIEDETKKSVTSDKTSKNYFKSSTSISTDTIKIQNLGNSIVQAQDLWIKPDSTWIHVGYDSYRRRLAQKLDSAGISYDMVGSLDSIHNWNGILKPHWHEDFDVDHEGHWGWKTDELLNGHPAQPERGKLSIWLSQYDIDFVLLRIGSNDMFAGEGNQQILSEISEVISVLRGKNPNVVVFLANFSPFSREVGGIVYDDPEIVAFNNLLPGFIDTVGTAISPVILVDQYTGFSLSEDTYDNVHPNQSGEEKMAQRYFEAIYSYLENNTTWTGVANTDWANPSNWSNGVPDNNKNVIIPAGLTNYPILSSAGECNNLHIESGSGSTGSLIGQSYLTVYGTVTIERHMNGNAWHLTSSPAPGQTISTFLSQNNNIPTNNSGGRGMMEYDVVVDDWTDFFTNTTGGNLLAGKGYGVRTDADGVVTFNGTLETDTVSASVSNNGGRWNEVGNPYPSSVYINDAADATNNFIDVNFNNFDPSYVSVYVWEEGNNAYTIFTQSDAAFNAQVGQGFFVKAGEEISQFQFTTNMQTHAPTAAFKSGSVPWPYVKLIVTNKDGEKRYTRIRFNDNMTRGLDPGYDAGIFKTGFDIYTQLLEDNGVDFGVQCLPFFSMEEFEIPVGINYQSNGEIQFSADYENLSSGIFPVLNDKLTGEEYVFTTSEDVYVTTVADDNSGFGRFTITFETITDVNSVQEQNLKAWFSNGKIVISGDVKQGAKVKLSDIQGRVLVETRLKNLNYNNLDIDGFANGIYLLQVENEGRRKTLKVPITN